MTEQYKEIVQDGEIAIFRVADSAWIPCSPANIDYQAYLRWLAEGNVPQR